MPKTIDFRIRGDDPTLSKLKAMLEGIKDYRNDRTMTISEFKVISVTTDRDDVATILNNIQKGNPIDGKISRKYKPRKNEDPATGDDAWKPDESA